MHYLSKHRFLGQKDSLLGYSNRIKVLGLFLISAVVSQRRCLLVDSILLQWVTARKKYNPGVGVHPSGYITDSSRNRALLSSFKVL